MTRATQEPTGGDALWREQIQSRYVRAEVMDTDAGEIANGARDPWALDLQGGYGIRMPGERLLSWTGSLNHSPAGPCFTLGARIALNGAPIRPPLARPVAPPPSKQGRRPPKCRKPTPQNWRVTPQFRG